MTDRPTLATWRRPPFSRTAFQRVRELIPTAAIPCPTPRPLPAGPAADGLGALAVPAPGGGETTWEALVAAQATDACLVLHRGAKVWDWHAPHFDPGLPHLLFSVTKSVTGALAGVLVDEGRLDPAAPVTHYIPELAGSAFEGATVRHALDMGVSSTLEEIYDDPDADYMLYRSATGWNPPRPDAPGDLLSFLRTMRTGAEPHGQTFLYLSPVTDAVGLVLERASGERWHDLLSTRIWAPMGAAGPADMTLDALGAPRGAGGLSCTLDDLARFGEVMRQGGKGPGGRQIVPAEWVADIYAGGDRAAWERGDSRYLYPGGGYRAQWYRTPEPLGAIVAMGIHGQWLWTDPATEVTIARVSSQAEAIDDPYDLAFIAAMPRVAAALAAREV